jgi:hypothetical protein
LKHARNGEIPQIGFGFNKGSALRRTISRTARAIPSSLLGQIRRSAHHLSPRSMTKSLPEALPAPVHFLLINAVLTLRRRSSGVKTMWLSMPQKNRQNYRKIKSKPFTFPLCLLICNRWRLTEAGFDVPNVGVHHINWDGI